MPDCGIAAKETVVQTEVGRQGYPTPRVHALIGTPSSTSISSYSDTRAI